MISEEGVVILTRLLRFLRILCAMRQKEIAVRMALGAETRAE
jgi:hypothetical protein